MQHFCICKHFLSDIFCIQHNICARFSHKRKGALSALIQGDKGQRRHRFIRQLRAKHFDLIVFQCLFQKLTKVIIAKAAKKAGLKPVPCDRNAGICRCSARIAHIAPLLFSRCKINQHFPHTDNIHD